MENRKIEIPSNVRTVQFTYEVGEVEFYRIQLSYILPKLNNTTVTLLAYFKKYGDKAKDKLLSEGIITSTNTFYTYKNSLTKSKYLIGYDINPDINLLEYSENPVLIFAYLKPSKENNEVNHKHYRATIQS